MGEASLLLKFRAPCVGEVSLVPKFRGPLWGGQPRA